MAACSSVAFRGLTHNYTAFQHLRKALFYSVCSDTSVRTVSTNTIYFNHYIMLYYYEFLDDS